MRWRVVQARSYLEVWSAAEKRRERRSVRTPSVSGVFAGGWMALVFEIGDANCSAKRAKSMT